MKQSVEKCVDEDLEANEWIELTQELKHGYCNEISVSEQLNI